MLAAALVLTGSAAAMYAVQHGAAPRDASQASATKPAPAAPVRNAPPQQLAAPQPLPEAQAPHRVVPSERAPQPRANEPRANEPRANEARNGEDLLERANRLRGDGQYRAAERTYLRVVAQTPTGAAAYSARVAAASLALEQLGEPKTALRLYEEAARTNPGGALSPEIHEGTAHAHRALGQRDAERRALNALLEEQPAGPAAERARKRLRVLDAGN
jgi:tetratricopeptide (TPR) repeat protein